MSGRHQVAAIPVRRTPSGDVEVLLVTSRETRRWVVPKGWPWAGRSDQEAAAREAWEEAGLRGQVRPERLGSFAYEKRRDGAVLVLDVDVYVMVVDEFHSEWPEAGQRERSWFALDQAARLVAEAGLRDLILAIEGVGDL